MGGPGSGRRKDRAACPGPEEAPAWRRGRPRKDGGRVLLNAEVRGADGDGTLESPNSNEVGLAPRRPAGVGLEN